MGRKQRWTRELCIRRLELYLEANARHPPDNGEPLWAYGLPSHSVFKEKTGVTMKRYAMENLSHLYAAPDGTHTKDPGHQRAARRMGLPPPEPTQTWNRDSTAEAIHAFVRRHNRFPEREEFTQEGGLPSLSTATRLLGMDYIALRRRLWEKAGERADRGN